MENKKRHPFSYTLGPGPYSFVGFGQITFSDNYGSKYIGPSMDIGCGTCSHCGHAILNIFIVKTSTGKRCGVGSDCILKIKNDGQFDNISAFEKELKFQKRKAGQSRRENQRVNLKKKIIDLVTFNEDKLKAISYETSKTKTAYDYCSWYIKTEHSLGGYKMFEKKLNLWGIL